MEVKNYLKLYVDKKQDDIKYLKLKCNKDDKDKVREISDAKTPMKSIKSVCVPCYQTFVVTNGLYNHFMEGHMIQCKPLFPL